MSDDTDLTIYSKGWVWMVQYDEFRYYAVDGENLSSSHYVGMEGKGKVGGDYDVFFWNEGQANIIQHPVNNVGDVIVDPMYPTESERVLWELEMLGFPYPDDELLRRVRNAKQGMCGNGDPELGEHILGEGVEVLRYTSDE